MTLIKWFILKLKALRFYYVVLKKIQKSDEKVALIIIVLSPRTLKRYTPKASLLKNDAFYRPSNI